MDASPKSMWRRNLACIAVIAAPGALLVMPALHSGAQVPPTQSKGEVAPTASNEIVLKPEQERALDVKTVEATKRRGDHPIITGGKVSLDLEHTVRVRPLLNSIIYEVKKRAGDIVKKGDELLVVESTDLGDLKNNYLTALANLEVAAETYKREALLRASHATTETDYHNSRAAFRNAVVAAEAAREKALLLGVSGAELDALESELPAPELTPAEAKKDGESGDDLAMHPPDEKDRQLDARRALREIGRRREHRTLAADEDTRARARYTIRAPIDGVLLTKDAARGEYVDPSQVIATVSDVSQLWINVDIYQNDISRIRIGARVDVETPSYPGVAFVGSVTFISESVDDTTHTLKARVVVENERRLLKSGMAAKTTVHCIDEEARIELPPEAVVREGQETYVIVRKAPGRYERRKVELGLEALDAVHVTKGLEDGEQVVLEGNLFIHTKIPLGD